MRPIGHRETIGGCNRNSYQQASEAVTMILCLRRIVFGNVWKQQQRVLGSQPRFETITQRRSVANRVRKPSPTYVQLQPTLVLPRVSGSPGRQTTPTSPNQLRSRHCTQTLCKLCAEPNSGQLWVNSGEPNSVRPRVATLTQTLSANSETKL